MFKRERLKSNKIAWGISSQTSALDNTNHAELSWLWDDEVPYRTTLCVHVSIFRRSHRPHLPSQRFTFADNTGFGSRSKQMDPHSKSINNGEWDTFALISKPLQLLSRPTQQSFVQEVLLAQIDFLYNKANTPPISSTRVRARLKNTKVKCHSHTHKSEAPL